MRRIPLLLLACFAGTLFGQQTTPSALPQGFGQVTGRVFCNDTGLPARFASVQLVAENPTASPLFDPAMLGKNPNFAKLMASAISEAMKGSNLGTLTALDGSFSLGKVPPGTYYVIPQLPGYLSPVSGIPTLDRMKAGKSTMAEVEVVAEKVVVQAGQSSYLNISLKRGGVITGTVQYDDGSPSPGADVGLLTQEKDGTWKDLNVSMMPTKADERGQFRFYGLPAGDYAVKATLPVAQAMVGVGVGSISMHVSLGDALVVYSGGAMREKDIKPIEVGDGDEVDGINVTFPIHGIYTVSGSVVAKSDEHAVSVGTMSLEYSDTKKVLRTAMIGSDGTFAMNYVPPGSYILTVTSAGDAAPGSAGGQDSLAALLGGKKPIKEYGSAEMPLNLSNSDATGLVLQVPDAVTATPPPLPPPPPGTGTQ
jgi:hypothetical protein